MRYRDSDRALPGRPSIYAVFALHLISFITLIPAVAGDRRFFVVAWGFALAGLMLARWGMRRCSGSQSPHAEAAGLGFRIAGTFALVMVLPLTLLAIRALGLV